VRILPDVINSALPKVRILPDVIFAITVGKHRIQAKTLEFMPIPDIVGGIQLLVPRTMINTLHSGQDAEELAWLIVETGIGEELSSHLQHIEFSHSEGVKDKRPITALALFVQQNT
jgi:hypothetical protein